MEVAFYIFNHLVVYVGLTTLDNKDLSILLGGMDNRDGEE